MKMSKTEFIKWLQKADKDEIKKKEVIDITFDGEVIRRFVPKSWHNPIYSVH